MRLIDADALKQDLRKCQIESLIAHTEEKNVFDIINEQPTAYDVEKVVEEIRRSSGNGYRDIDGDWVPPLIETKEAIDIVKRGGVE